MRRNVYVVGDNQRGVDIALALCQKPTNAVTLVTEYTGWSAGRYRGDACAAEASAGRLNVINFHRLFYVRPYAVLVADPTWLDVAWSVLVLQRPLPCYFVALDAGRDLLQLALRSVSNVVVTATYRNGQLLCPDTARDALCELLEGVRP